MKAFLYGMSALAYWLAYTGRRPVCISRAQSSAIFAGDGVRNGKLPDQSAEIAKHGAKGDTAPSRGAAPSAEGTARGEVEAGDCGDLGRPAGGGSWDGAETKGCGDLGQSAGESRHLASRPSAAGAASRAFALFPHVSMPLHLLVPNPAKVNAKGVVCHRSSRSFGAGSFCPIDEVVGACSPELCFVQVARHFPFHQAVKAGCALCGTFAVNPQAQFGLSSRRPLTTKAEIAKYLEANRGIAGAKRARRALKYVVDGCASPAEIRLAMVLTLPHAKGGFSLSGFLANQPIDLGKKEAKVAGRRRVIPDLLNTARKVAVEYDADVTHASAQRRMQDATKRMVLESLGFKVVTVTTRQLALTSKIRDVAEEICKHVGAPLHIKSSAFERSHRLLMEMPRSFDGLFSPCWLANRAA